MDKTLQEMQIKVARHWAGVEEMQGCEWSLVEIEGPGLQIVNAEWFFADNLHSPTAKRKYYGPYIKIEDGNPWSSAAILARCGWEAQHKSLSSWLEWLWFKDDALGKWEKQQNYFRALCKVLANGDYEFANNLALQWLHKNAHDVWLKGMELCN